MRKIALTAALTLVLMSPALALNGTLGRGNGKVFVWKDKDAQSEGINLIMADVHKTNPMLVMRLMSCVVDDGTSAITTSAGIMTHDILVTGGPNSGCRGNIPREDFKIQR